MVGSSGVEGNREALLGGINVDVVNRSATSMPFVDWTWDSWSRSFECGLVGEWMVLLRKWHIYIYIWQYT